MIFVIFWGVFWLEIFVIFALKSRDFQEKSSANTEKKATKSTKSKIFLMFEKSQDSQQLEFEAKIEEM